MQIVITSRHFQLADAARDKILKKITGLIRHAGQITKARVVVSREKFRYQAEVLITGIGQGKVLSIRDNAGDPVSAVILAAEKIDEQIIKFRDKRRRYENFRHPEERGN
jgi:ribosomal subunit interface protein